MDRRNPAWEIQNSSLLQRSRSKTLFNSSTKNASPPPPDLHGCGLPPAARPRQILFALALVAAAFPLLPHVALAQTTRTWDPNSNQKDSPSLNGNWDTGVSTYWYNSSIPADQDWTNDGSATAVFGWGGGSGTYTITLDNQSILAAGLVFNSDPGGFDFVASSGQTLTLGSGGITVAAGNPTETLDTTLAIALSSNQTWTNNSTAGTLTVNGGITSTGGTDTLMVAGAGSTTIAGAIANGSSGGTVGLTMSGSGTFRLAGANSYTGATTVNAGILSLTGSLSSTNGLVLGGGTFSYAPAANGGTGNTQNLGGLTINSGPSTIAVTTGNTLAINAASFTHNTGGVVNFNPSGSGQITTTNTAGDGTGIIGPWAFYQGTSYAAVPASAGGSIAGYQAVTPLSSATSSSGTTNFYDQTTFSPSTSVAANTVQFLVSSGTTATITPYSGSGGTFAVNGILNSGSGTLTFASGTGTLTAGVGSTHELVIGGGSGSGFTISSVIANNGTASAVTYAGTGTLTLSGNNTFSGPLTIDSGTVYTSNATNFLVPGSAQAIGEASTLALNGGMLEYNGGTGTYIGNAANAGSTLAISVGSNGGTLWNNSSSTSYLSYDGVISGSGNLTVLSPTGASNSSNNGQIFIEGSSPSFTGNFIIGNAAGTIPANIQYRSSSANAFGVGTIVINGEGLLAADGGNTTPSLVTNSIILNGGYLGTQGATMTYSGPVTLAAGSTSKIAGFSGNGGSVTMSGVISGTGTLQVGVSSATGDTVYFTNTDTYSGATTVSTGTMGARQWDDGRPANQLERQRLQRGHARVQGSPLGFRQ